jgi:multidrug resistance efflux pump
MTSSEVCAIGDLVWHIHHDILVEPLTEPIENRIAFIKANKPKNEVETRLRLMKPVRGKLPKLNKARAELDKARAELDKARAEWNKAGAEWNKASAELDKARAELDKARAEWNKACAELDKARAEWDKARAELHKAHAEWYKARAAPSVLKLHAKECPNCPWNGETIFP